MAKQVINPNVDVGKSLINVGTAPDAKNGDKLRDAFININDAIDRVDSNFTELYATLAVSSLTELAQDYAATMLTTGTHSGVNVEYIDSTNKLNITVTIDGGTASTTF
jgi:hypothetical protein